MAARRPRGRPSRRRWTCAAVTVACALLSGAAGARPMDPVLSRLVVDPSCSERGAPCAADHAKYVKLVSQLGFALAPNSAREGRTNGLLGFDVSVLASITNIDDAADYWRLGTRGAGADAAGNPDPDGTLQLYALELRKGFGFGIEAAASLGVMPRASLLSWGADVRVALLEGMRYGLWRYFPDTSIGVGVRRATGLGQLALGTLALDGRLSHPWAFPAGFVLTPWLGYQWVRISADSALVDFTPGVDAVGECGFAGSNVPSGAGTPEVGGAVPVSGAPPGVFDGAALCQPGAGADLVNSTPFGAAAVHRHRAVLGISYRRELLRVAAELATDIVRPDAAQPNASVARALRCDESGASCSASPRQWTVSLGLGASF